MTCNRSHNCASAPAGPPLNTSDSTILVSPQIRGSPSISCPNEWRSLQWKRSHITFNGGPHHAERQLWAHTELVLRAVAGVQVSLDVNPAKHSPTRSSSCLAGVDILIYPEFINVILHSSIWAACADRLVRFPWTALTSSRPGSKRLDGYAI